MKNTKSLLDEDFKYRIVFSSIFKKITLLLILILTSGFLKAQSITISGNVKDHTGDPIIGANIATLNQKTGAITDIDGNFKVETKIDGSITVSYLGYKSQTIKIKNKNPLSIIMHEDITELDQVIVIGYGSQRVKDVTGSMAPVDIQSIIEKPVANLSEALAGEIPGLNVTGTDSRPGTNTAISIRQGFSSSKGGGTSGPLIVIDDIIQVNPETGDPDMTQFNLLDPSEIESMTVLRDASAAIYGSRASQGAIVIKTKRGTKGTPRITYSGKFQMKDAISHSKVMGAYDYGVFSNRFLRAKQIDNQEQHLFSNSELESMRGLNYDWLDKAWKSAFAMQHSINVSGGSETATYFAGVSYYDQGANLGEQDYDRWTFRAGSDIKILSNLKLSAGLSANSTSQRRYFTKGSNFNDGGYGSLLKGENADYGVLLHMPRYIPWSQEVNGRQEWVSPALGPHQANSSANIKDQVGAWNYFATQDDSFSNDDFFSYNANFSVQYDFKHVKGLSLRAFYSRSQSSNDGEQAYLPYRLALGTNTNQMDSHLYGDHTEWIVQDNDKSSRVVYSTLNTLSEQMNLFASYNNTFGNHTVGALFSIEKNENEARFKKLFYENPIKGGYNGTHNTAGTLIPDHSQSMKTESGGLSYLGRLTYKYDSRYLAEFIFRADASTKFAPENYWGFFPGISAAWVVSEEDWFKGKGIEWIDYLKIRASFGITGKDNIKAWRWAQLYQYSADKGLGFGGEGGNNVPGINPEIAPNRNIKWDQTNKYNIGLDFNLLSNRLTGSVDFYYDQTRDLITDMSGEIGTPISAGGGISEQNYASIDAWGSEIQLTWKDKVGDFDYSIGVHTSLQGNKWKKQIDQGYTLPSKNAATVGGSTYMPTWGFKVWKDNGGNGVLRNQADIDQYWDYLTANANAANTTPHYLGGIKSKDAMRPGMLAFQDLGGPLNSNGSQDGPDGRINADEDYGKLLNKNKSHGFTTKLGLGWKGISFSMNLATSWGTYAYIDNVKQQTGNGRMIWSHPTFLTDMFDPEDNPMGKYPSIAYDGYGATSDFWKVSGFRAYVKTMSIGYSIPSKLTKKVGIEKVQFNLSGNNLWDFYNPYPKKYRNMYDSATAGYPTLRTWSFGVNLTL